MIVKGSFRYGLYGLASLVMLTAIARAETPATEPATPQAPPAATAQPPGSPPSAASPVPGATSPVELPDGFGELVELKPVPVLQKQGQSSWDEGFDTIVATLKEVDAELARLGLKPAGSSLIIYTATDDAGFDFEAAVPFSGATTQKPQAGLELAASPAGKAMRFTHRGAYDAMDPTYEQIANLLDAKDLEAQDLYIEEYRSDPRTTSPDDLVIDILVPLK